MKGKEGRFIKRGGCQRLCACHIKMFQILFFCCNKVIYRPLFKQEYILDSKMISYITFTICECLESNNAAEGRAGCWSKIKQKWPFLVKTFEFLARGNNAIFSLWNVPGSSLFFSRRGLSTYKGVVNFLRTFGEHEKLRLSYFSR